MTLKTKLFSVSSGLITTYTQTHWCLDGENFAQDYTVSGGGPGPPIQDSGFQQGLSRPKSDHVLITSRRLHGPAMFIL